MKKATKAAKQNPITTIFGILAIAATLAPVWAPAEYASRIQASAAILTSGGLIAAADGRKEK